MQIIINFFETVAGFGASVMMPIIIFIFGLCLRAGVGKSLRAGLTVGVGFIGLNLVIGMMGSHLGPAVESMTYNFGFVQLPVMDVGWPAAAAIAFGSTVGAVIIPVGLLINIVMLLTKTTQTVNIDIWNYWHFAFTGALVAVLVEGLTGSAAQALAFGTVAAGLNMIIVMVMADVTAPGVEEYNGLPGISLPHGFTTSFVPGAIVLNWIMDKIPGLNKVDIDMTKMQVRFGVFGEPILVGTFLGIVIGAAAGYHLFDTSAGPSILLLGITLGAALVLIPKMAAMLMEGLMPISDAAGELISKRFSSRGKVYIGLDSAVGIGHPTTLAVSLILVPLAVFIAVILPGNQMLPMADLAVIPFMFVLIIPVVKNNGFRAFIIGIFTLITGFWIATNLAPEITQAAYDSGFMQAEIAGGQLISSICDGAVPFTWGILRVQEWTTPVIGTVIVAVISVAMAVWNRIRIGKEAAKLAAGE
ncbi:MAG: PTS sugar transporter subunit IIC [Oscillospiraceae bacterium]|nr:PTS sugar transporter subunit IIC [Oscillospiraceae bacterium]